MTPLKRTEKSSELQRANDQAYFRSRKPPEPLKTEVGREVAYTRYFLKCIAAPPTDPIWRRRGTVIKVDQGFAHVQWHDYNEGDVTTVNLANLSHPGPNLAFCE